jgi:hydroxyacylglutathione hydrolase
MEDARVLVEQIRVGPMANFAYLLADQEGGEGLVVDSGWETGPILRSVESAGVRVKYAVATHGHFDHTATLRELGVALGAMVVAHRDSPIDCDLKVDGGDELELGGERVLIMHTPGHTEDSICLYTGGSLFTGDTLFVGTIGKVERSNAEVMYKSLRSLVRLPEETVVLPGHDYGEVASRTLKEEKGANPFLLARDLKGFLSLFS